MDIRDACEDIMGEKLASSIIADMGISWCVVAAMADPRNAKRPRACGVIRTWLAEQKATSVSGPKCTWPDCDQPSGHDYCYAHCVGKTGPTVPRPHHSPAENKGE